MKKIYMEPEMNVVCFAAEDIMEASFEGIGGDNETEIIWDK